MQYWYTTYFADRDFDVVGGPRGRGFNRESRAITLDKGLSIAYCQFCQLIMQTMEVEVIVYIIIIIF